jgi:hypothetical protein
LIQKTIDTSIQEDYNYTNFDNLSNSIKSDKRYKSQDEP